MAGRLLDTRWPPSNRPPVTNIRSTCYQQPTNSFSPAAAMGGFRPNSLAYKAFRSWGAYLSTTKKNVLILLL